MVHVANFILVAGVLPGDRHSFEDQSLADIVRSPGVLMLLVAIFLTMTYTEVYNKHMLLMSLIVAFILCIINLSFVVLVPMKTDPLSFPTTSDISPVGAFLHLHRTPDGDLHFDPAQTLHEHHDRNLLLVGVRNSNALSPEPTVRRLHHHGPAVVAHLHPPDRAPHPHHDQRAHEEHVHEGRAELAGEAPARIREEAKGEHDPLADAVQRGGLVAQRGGDLHQERPAQLGPRNQRHPLAFSSVQHESSGKREHPLRRHRRLHQDGQQEERRRTGGNSQQPLPKVRPLVQVPQLREDLDVGGLLLLRLGVSGTAPGSRQMLRGNGVEYDPSDQTIRAREKRGGQHESRGAHGDGLVRDRRHEEVQI
jgi:hypothetical protein